MDDDDPGIHAEDAPSGARVFGRLRARLAFWQLFASALVVGWLRSGYPLEFIDGLPPPARVGRNHASAAQEAAFVSAAIADLLASGAAVAVTAAPTVVSPLGVATRADGKRRLILDLRYVNSFLVDHHCVWEGWGS